MENYKMNFKPIDINTFVGRIPTGYDLVVVEKSHVSSQSDFDATILYGFDEIGMFDKDFIEPQYGFLKIETV